MARYSSMESRPHCTGLDVDAGARIYVFIRLRGDAKNFPGA
jgi:hypothetical protein